MCAYAVGIDLGTTNSCVGVYRDGKVEIFQNEHYSYVIPSWVTFTDDGILTGHEAKDEAHKYVRNTIFEVKRLIGQNYEDPKIQKYIERLPYDVVDDNGLLKIKVEHQGNSHEYFPEVISSFILQNLKDLAESRLGQKVTKVVVTVPAYFNDIQRAATKSAAIIAGFEEDNVHIINEPTAAAVAFSYQNEKRYRRNVLVYDFGGGTFDVSIVTVGRGECVVKATGGDLLLGGTDIDANLVKHIKDDFKEQFGEDIEDNDEGTRRLLNACEKIKKKLSGEQLTVEIEMNGLSGRDYFSEISRQEFEDLNEEIFERTLSIVESCLNDSGFTKDEIDEVVLVGGSSRIPKVQQMLKDYFNEDKINKGVNPDEAVAYGAAIHATCLMGNKSEVKDIISLSLGVAVLNNYSSIIIPRNTPVPTKCSKPYITVSDNQETALIEIFQGEEIMVQDNIELGEFTLTGLRKAAAGDVKIDVCFEVDCEGILNVTASETGTSNESNVKIDMKKKGLTPEERLQSIFEMEEHRKNDLKRREFLGKKHNLEKLCNNVFTNADMISDSEQKTEILDKCREISEWLKNISISDQDEVEDKKNELEEICDYNPLVIGEDSGNGYNVEKNL